MKTYDEACEIFLVQGSITDSDEMKEAAIKKLEETVEVYKSMLDEIQTNPKSAILAHMFYNYGTENDLCAHQILILGISHGVAIGMEMNKQDAFTS